MDHFAGLDISVKETSVCVDYSSLALTPSSERVLDLVAAGG
jgi:hypothetical protein